LAKKKKKIIFTTMINGRLTTYMKKEKVINQPSLKTYGVITNERAKVKEKNDKKNKKRE
jgi:folate-dependent tRNA-U54 methylase TrmFO/GidA